MKFITNYLNRTGFHIAIEKGYPEIVQLLLDNEKNDVTAKGILKSIFFNIILNLFIFNYILKKIVLIKFKNKNILIQFQKLEIINYIPNFDLFEFCSKIKFFLNSV